MSGFFAFQIVISDDREGGRGLEGLISIRIVPDRRAQRRGSKSRRRCQFAPISLSSPPYPSRVVGHSTAQLVCSAGLFCRRAFNNGFEILRL